MNRDQLLAHLNELLSIANFKDYAPNGLQVEGASSIKKVLTAVSASQSAIEAAIDFGAQALLVHHGYFWKGEAAQIVGMKKRRLQLLLQHDINLLAYHLPLDQHPCYGNNYLFGKMLGAEGIRQSQKEPLLWHGKINSIDIRRFSEDLGVRLRRPAQLIASTKKEISRIAWCTGAAQDYLSLASLEGADVFISGEYAERTFYEARENNIAYISCGHHASERFGVCALADYLKKELKIEAQFFDDNNPF